MAEFVATLAEHGLLWVLLLAAIVPIVGVGRIRALFSSISKVEFAGVRIDLDASSETDSAERWANVTKKAKSRLAKRLRLAQPRMARTRFLWIDDSPRNNAFEMSILKAMGATIDLALSDVEARERLRGAVYDVVLSDVNRNRVADAGYRFLPEVTDAVLSPPVIFYTLDDGHAPVGAFGLTTSPNELFHLILDALERTTHKYLR